MVKEFFSNDESVIPCESLWVQGTTAYSAANDEPNVAGEDVEGQDVEGEGGAGEADEWVETADALARASSSSGARTPHSRSSPGQMDGSRIRASNAFRASG